MKGYDQKISSRRIFMRKLAENDASEKYAGWIKDTEVNKFVDVKDTTLEELRSYIKDKMGRADTFFAGIFDKETEEHIGNVKLEPIDWKKKEAFFGILIGDKNYWGKGIGTEATKLCLDFAFDTLRIKKVKLSVIRDNEKASYIYEKVGFKEDYVKEKAVNYGGILYDDVYMSMNKDERKY